MGCLTFRFTRCRSLASAFWKRIGNLWYFRRTFATAARKYSIGRVSTTSKFLQDLWDVGWYSPQWLQNTLDTALHTFDRSCDRWRNLYRDADTQLQEARKTIDRHSRGNANQKERDEAEFLAKEAQRQRDLLVGQYQHKNNNQFDFYPYRYLAAEGFLPGFNFPRLPVRTYTNSLNLDYTSNFLNV